MICISIPSLRCGRILHKNVSQSPLGRSRGMLIALIVLIAQIAQIAQIALIVVIVLSVRHNPVA